MSQLIAGEYDVTLNGCQIHYTVRGSELSPLISEDWRKFAENVLCRSSLNIEVWRYLLAAEAKL